MNNPVIKYESPPAKILRFLLIEDDVETGYWLIKKTGIAEYAEINWAKNLSDAYAEIEKNSPDLIILDLNLPDGSGIKILKKIKTEKLKITVFIFSINNELKNACLKLGASRFFDKSIDSEKLIRALQAFHKG